MTGQRRLRGGSSLSGLNPLRGAATRRLAGRRVRGDISMRRRAGEPEIPDGLADQTGLVTTVTSIKENCKWKSCDCDRHVNINQTVTRRARVHNLSHGWLRKRGDHKTEPNRIYCTGLVNDG